MGTTKKRSKNDPRVRALIMIRIAHIGDHHGAEIEMARFLGWKPSSYYNYENAHSQMKPSREEHLLKKIEWLGLGALPFLRYMDQKCLTANQIERLGLGPSSSGTSRKRPSKVD